MTFCCVVYTFRTKAWTAVLWGSSRKGQVIRTKPEKPAQANVTGNSPEGLCRWIKA